MIFLLIAAHAAGAANELDLSQNLDDIVDCLYKYQIILARPQKGMGKFEDN